MPAAGELRAIGDRELAVDAAAIALVSVAICVWADELALMSALVPAVVVIRFVAWRRAAPPTASLVAELALFAVCTVVGAFNDWNSVVRHEVYAYSAPHYFPGVTTIPLWMLLYWGVILRFLAALFRWRRLRPPARVRNDVSLGRARLESAWVKVAAQLALIAITRQLIYRWYADPVLSWMPFAAALVVALVALRPDRHDWTLLAVFCVGGPAIEVLYIQLGDLHHYALGWLAGVPLWIALWWVLAALLWKDLSARLQLALARQVA